MPDDRRPQRPAAASPLRVRVLGRVPYAEAYALQRALHERSADDYLLVLEHPHVFTLGRHADPANVLVDPAEVGAELVRTDRGGDVTYHGPGQLVVYPVLSVPFGPGAVPGHVHAMEQVVIDTLADAGLTAGRLEGYPGVWVDPGGSHPRKICAVGTKVARGRTLHGLALNVHTDLAWFGRIVPCGIADKAVTSLAAEGVDLQMAEVAELLVARAAARWATDRGVDHQHVDVPSWSARAADQLGTAGQPRPVDQLGTAGQPRPAAPQAVVLGPSSAPGERGRRRLRQAGVDPDAGLPVSARKPPWLRLQATMGDPFLALGRTVRTHGLVTVCEEAGCPNIFECWADGTATFMINGERCTRSCGFCLVDTRRPGPLDPEEPERVAEAVAELGLSHAVVTAVARDDLADGGAAAFAATIAAVRRRSPATTVEVLVPDCRGDAGALATILSAAPDVLNHNLETVARLQRAVRPSAGYARSLAVLARAKDRGLTTKSGLMVGLGETAGEMEAALRDLRAVGVDIVTVGQYLRPTRQHLPVARWWPPDEIEALGELARSLGFAHVEAAPLARSSYHARQGARAAAGGRDLVGRHGTAGGQDRAGGHDAAADRAAAVGHAGAPLPATSGPAGAGPGTSGPEA